MVEGRVGRWRLGDGGLVILVFWVYCRWGLDGGGGFSKVFVFLWVGALTLDGGLKGDMH